MKVKKSFVLYHDFRNWFSLLTDEELGRLIRAIFDYEMNKELPENLNEKEQIAFFMVRDILDRDREKYERVCNRNKENARVRWEKMKKYGIEIPAEERERYE
ncbi:MAG: hypothetical protein IJ289_00315 [Clostridia bacterium]|nr:hypothetical protein [Clostridia bacterium]